MPLLPCFCIIRQVPLEATREPALISPAPPAFNLDALTESDKYHYNPCSTTWIHQVPRRPSLAKFDYLTTLVGYLYIKFHYDMYDYRCQDREYLYHCRE